MAKKILSALVVVVGAFTLAACATDSCGRCKPCTPIYKKPCCAQSQNNCGCAAPAAAPAAMPAPTAKPAMACGTGKCG